MDWLTLLIPDMLAPNEAGFLIVLAGFTSLLTAVMGIGGGALLIAVMAQVVPVAALIPVHGMVQFGSNVNRAAMTHRHIDHPWLRSFLYGSVVGALIASLIVVQLPLVAIQLSVGLFILWMVWGPKPRHAVMSPAKVVLAGAFTTLVSMFVGATGPLVGGLLHRAGGDKMGRVATMAAALTIQHGLKIFVFAFVGFAFSDWLPLIVMMIASGALGTWIGLHLLHRMSSALFNTVFRWVITLLALRLVYQGALALAAA